jgi:hypothetical protein
MQHVRNHVTVLGALYIAFGILFGLPGLLVMTAGAGAGAVAATGSAEPGTAAVVTGLGLAGGLVLLALAAPALIGGIGLLKRKPWARIPSSCSPSSTS